MGGFCFPSLPGTYFNILPSSHKHILNAVLDLNKVPVLTDLPECLQSHCGYLSDEK